MSIFKRLRKHKWYRKLFPFTTWYKVKAPINVPAKEEFRWRTMDEYISGIKVTGLYIERETCLYTKFLIWKDKRNDT